MIVNPMKKRRFLLLGMAGIACLVLLGMVWLLKFRPGITQSNCERIREGMTLQEVQSVLGGPPGNYSRFPDKEAGLWTIDADRPDLNREFFIGREVWIGNELAVAVWFNDEERVEKKETYQMPKRDLLQRLRDLFFN